MEEIIKFSVSICLSVCFSDCQTKTNFNDDTLCTSKFKKKNCICLHTECYKNKTRKKTGHREETSGSSSQVSPCHEWHKQIFSYFRCISFKFPFCVLEMNIWSFPPEPVTNGPLKLRDTALCFWHCGIYRRKRSNSSAEREHEKLNIVSWQFTCLEALFVSNVLTTNV